VAIARNLLLAMSTNAWLRERATKTAFVRRSVSAFMPGERVEDAMQAAAAQQQQGIATMLTRLGENVTRGDEAEAVTRHYLEVLDAVHAAGLRAQISVKPTQLGLDVDPRLGEFQADERKVKQILLNLLSNAVKFTPDGGRVDVIAKMDTTVVAIAVQDTGIGIAPEDQAAVFEEFKQVGRDYTRKAEGTGLGLALTKRFVELHGGEISLASELGHGSTFTITLPIRQ